MWLDGKMGENLGHGGVHVRGGPHGRRCYYPFSTGLCLFQDCCFNSLGFSELCGEDLDFFLFLTRPEGANDEISRLSCGEAVGFVTANRKEFPIDIG